MKWKTSKEMKKELDFLPEKVFRDRLRKIDEEFFGTINEEQHKTLSAPKAELKIKNKQKGILKFKNKQKEKVIIVFTDEHTFDHPIYYIKFERDQRFRYKYIT
jgi:hypothetical protein